MSKIAFVGSGVNGLLAAHGLLKQGHDVTLISERSAADWLDKVPPTGTACRFATSPMPASTIGTTKRRRSRACTSHSDKPGWQLIDLIGRLERPARSISKPMPASTIGTTKRRRSRACTSHSVTSRAGS